MMRLLLSWCDGFNSKTIVLIFHIRKRGRKAYKLYHTEDSVVGIRTFVNSRFPAIINSTSKGLGAKKETIVPNIIKIPYKKRITRLVNKT